MQCLERNSSLKAGTVVTLPQKSPDVSYNASVAAGILMSIIGHTVAK